MCSNELKDFQHYHIEALKARIKQLENELKKLQKHNARSL